MKLMDMLEHARSAKKSAALLTQQEKNRALYAMADALEQNKEAILAANRLDVESVRGRIGDVMLDRLRLDEGRIRAMAQGMRDVAALKDPVGRVLEERTTADGLKIQKRSVPLGVLPLFMRAAPT